MKRNLLISVLVSIFLCIPFTVFGASEVPGVTDDQVVIGMTVPMSGPAAMWAAMGLGNLAWAQHINKQGGIHGRKIKVILKDDGYNPARALANMKDMKGDVFAYGCVIGSATAKATKDFLLESKAPVVHIHANPRMWVDEPPERMRNLFIAYPDYVDEACALTEFAVNKRGLKKIALFGQNDDWGKSAKEGVEKTVQKLGEKTEFAGFVPYEVTERSLSSHAMKLKKFGGDAVVIYAAPTQAALIIKEMAKVGYKPKIFTANPLGDPLMYKIAGDLWEGAYPAASGNVSMPGVEPKADEIVAVLTKYQPKLKGLKFLGITGATTMMLIEEGLRRAGPDLTREKFVEAMAGLKDFRPQGMGGPITFGPDRRHGLNSIRICEAKDGKHVPITDFIVFDPLF